MILRIAGSSILSVALAGCAASTLERAPRATNLRSHGPIGVTDAGGPQEQRILQPFPSTAAQAGGAWIPWASLDLGERVLVQGTPPADVNAGDGWAVRGGQYDDGLGMELVFASTEHDESRTGARLTTYAGYVDLTDRWELWRGPVFGWAGVGFGLGLMQFDWNRTYKSELTGLWQGEGILALQIGPNVSIEARAMAFLAAHPGRNVGSGLMTMLGGSIGF